MNSNQIRALVRKYRGIPYFHGGRDCKGLDCLGLVHLFYKDCGIEVPDGDGKEYSPRWVQDDPDRYLRGILKIGIEAPVDNLEPLDFVYFQLGKYISHGGIMIDYQYFIHVLQNTVVHLSPLKPVWYKRLVGARRLTSAEIPF